MSNDNDNDTNAPDIEVAVELVVQDADFDPSFYLDSSTLDGEPTTVEIDAEVTP